MLQHNIIFRVSFSDCFKPAYLEFYCLDAYSVHAMNTHDEKENRLTLDLLDAIEEKDDISQRHLAQEMGVALGLANAYLKRCVKKGLVKINSAPANRYLYYLTPQGFAEKARLTTQFLTTSLALVREARSDYQELFAQLANSAKDGKPSQKIILAGISDLTEIAYLRALETGVPLAAVWQPKAQVEQFFACQVLKSNQDLRDFVQQNSVDLAVVTSMEQTNQLLNILGNYLPGDKVVLPNFLRDLTYRIDPEFDAKISEESVQ